MTEQSMTPFQTFVRRVVSHSSLYMLGPVSGIFTGLFGLVILTRLLQPSAYGRLAVLLVFASFLTLLYNLGSYQGTNRAGFSTSDSDVLFPELEREEGRRVAMGCGISLTAVVGLVGTLVVSAFARPIAGLFLHDRHMWPAIMFAALEGMAGAVFRISANVLRLERRPAAWAVLQGARPLAALLASVLMVELGYGVTGVIAGWALGSTAMLAATLGAGRRSFRLAFSLRAVRPIYTWGAALAPAMVGFWIMGSGDILIASRLVSPTGVGRYRVDARIGSFVHPAFQSFLYGWGTLRRRDPVYFAAAQEQSGEIVDREVLSYFAAFVLGAVLFLAVFAHQLLFIVPQRYRVAELLVPILGARWAGQGILRAFYLVVEFHTKRRVFGFAVLIAALLVLAPAVILGHLYGVYGLAGATAVAPLLALGGLAVVAARERGYPRLEYKHLLVATVIAIACGVADNLVTRDSLLFGFAWLAAYLLLLIATGVLPLSRLREISGALRPAAVPTRVLLGRVTQLGARERRLLVGCVAHPPGRHSVALPEADDLAVFVRALREVGTGSASARETDVAVGKYILWPGAPAQRDAYAHDLWNMGVEPVEVDSLMTTYKRLRRRRRWLKSHAEGPPPGQFTASEAT